MSEVVLQPAKLRDDKFVLQRGADALTLGWKALRERFAPTEATTALTLLRMLKPGTFVGMRQRGRAQTMFVLDAAGCSSRIRGLTKKDPAFSTELVEVFLVRETRWDASMTEPERA